MEWLWACTAFNIRKLIKAKGMLRAALRTEPTWRSGTGLRAALRIEPA